MPSLVYLYRKNTTLSVAYLFRSELDQGSFIALRDIKKESVTTVEPVLVSKMLQNIPLCAKALHNNTSCVTTQRALMETTWAVSYLNDQDLLDINHLLGAHTMSII